jgi:hypothetical protein
LAPKPPRQPILQRLDQGQSVRSRGPAVPSPRVLPKRPLTAPPHPPSRSCWELTVPPYSTAASTSLQEPNFFEGDRHCISGFQQKFDDRKSTGTQGLVKGSSQLRCPRLRPTHQRVPHKLLSKTTADIVYLLINIPIAASFMLSLGNILGCHHKRDPVEGSDDHWHLLL